MNLKREQEYTFSAHLTDNTKEVDIYLGLDYYIGKTENQKITFTVNRVVPSRTLIVDTGSAGNIIDKVKLEKGSKATDWTTAPEDDKEYVNSQITISAEGIRAEVTSEINGKFSYVDQRVDSLTSVVATKASSTRVTQLANSYAIQYLNSTGSMVSQINLNNKGVNIDGKNITLNGDTNVQGNFEVSGNMISGGEIRGVTINVGSGAFKVTPDGTMTAGGGGFRVPPDADGVFNVFSPRDSVGGSGYGARWKMSNAHYIYQDGNAVAFYQSGLSYMFRKGSITNTAGNLSVGTSSGNLTLDPGSSKVWVSGMLGPYSNGGYDLGESGYKWNNLHVNTVNGQAINELSDARLKKDIQDIPAELMKYFEEVKPKLYKMNEQYQFGYIAQDVERALFRYASEVYGVDSARRNKETFNMFGQSENYLSLAYRQVNAIKDAEKDKKISELEQRIVNLEMKGEII